LKLKAGGIFPCRKAVTGKPDQIESCALVANSVGSEAGNLNQRMEKHRYGLIVLNLPLSFGIAGTAILSPSDAPT
jgi:hypothetical protein